MRDGMIVRSATSTSPSSGLRTDYLHDIRGQRLDDGWHAERSADLSQIEVPLLSAANWGGLGLHSRGNFEGFTRAGSAAKWLEVHTGRHEELFYTAHGLGLQRRFFDHFLKGADNGWDAEPPVQLAVRHDDQADRPPARTAGITRVHTGARTPSSLLLPVIG